MVVSIAAESVLPAGGKERCCKNDGMSGNFPTVQARDLELLGAVRMKIVSYWRRRSGRVYDQRGFEAKRRFRMTLAWHHASLVKVGHLLA